jgi:hypothetical protein
LLHGVDERLSRALARKSPRVIGADDDNLFAAVDSHMLRSLHLCQSNHLAESGFGAL